MILICLKCLSDEVDGYVVSSDAEALYVSVSALGYIGDGAMGLCHFWCIVCSWDKGR